MNGAGEHAQYSCVLHGQWPNSAQYAHCPVCKDQCHVIHVPPSEVMSMMQASSKQAQLLAHEAAERDAEARAAANQAALEAQHLQRTEQAAIAALHYDLDRWLEASFMEVAEWAGIEGDPTAWARPKRRPSGAEGYTAS